MTVATAVKGESKIMFRQQAIAARSDERVYCGDANALHVEVYVSGASPSATLTILGASERGGNYLALPDINATQTGVTSSQAFDVIVGQSWATVELSSLTGGTFTVWMTPYVAAGQPRVAASISVATLAAIQANIGAARIQDMLTMATGGVIKSGQTAYDTGTGFWLEYNGGTPRLSLGKSTANKLTWDGSVLTISGALTAITGAIGGWSIGATALTSGSGANSVGLDSGGTNPAIYAGSAIPGSAPFRVSQSGALVATSATITGAITASSGSFTGPLTLSGASGSIAIGTTPPTSATVGTGLWLDRTGLYGLASNVQQAIFDGTTGKITAGSGKVTLDSVGINVILAASQDGGRAYRMVNSSGTLIGDVFGYEHPLNTNYSILETVSIAGKSSVARINAMAPSGYIAESSLQSAMGGDIIYFQLVNSGADSTKTVLCNALDIMFNSGFLRVGSGLSNTGMVDGDIKAKAKVTVGGDLVHAGSNVGFYNTAAAAKQTVTGSRGANAALASLLTALSTIGLLTDSSSA